MSSSKASTAVRLYPRTSVFAGLMCLISTGVRAMSPLSLHAVQDGVDDVQEQVQEQHADDGRQIERSERRQDPPEQAEVRLANVVEEALDPVQPRRVRHAHPAADHVGEDQ